MSAMSRRATSKCHVLVAFDDAPVILTSQI